MLSWMLFKHYLLSRRSGSLVRLIAWLCMIGVGVGVASLIIVLSVMNGFNLNIRKNMLRFEPHLVVLNVKSKDEEKIKALLGKNIESILYAENQDVVLRTVDGNFSGAIAKGFNEGQLLGWLKQMKRSKPSEVITQLGPREALVGVDLASVLGVFEGDELYVIPPETLLLPPGDFPKYEKVIIKGLVSTQMPELDGKLFVYNSSKTLLGWWKNTASQQSGFEIRLSNPYEADEFSDLLKKKGFNVSSWHERNSSLFHALKMERLAMTIFLSLAVIITSFSIVSVMVLLITQKRREMGMLMAMGLSRRQTQSIFVQVGFILSTIGVGSGVLFGSFVAIVMDKYPIEILPDIYYDSTLPAKLSLDIVVGVVVGAAILAILGAYVPARSYVSKTPSESLRGIA